MNVKDGITDKLFNSFSRYDKISKKKYLKHYINVDGVTRDYIFEDLNNFKVLFSVRIRQF